ncbi:MAG: mannose-1-phosphate guanylyltransferase/mannose-6-phosphate isomerase [Pseudomonadota bacterium]
MLLPIILAGGAGTRLWPVSRETMPKPFMPIAGGGTLLHETGRRAAALPGVSDMAVVTNHAYAFKAAEEMADLGHGVRLSLLLEPEGRNTAPAVALAALWAQRRWGDSVTLLVLPADHVVTRWPDFVTAVSVAAQAARGGTLVTFGITPSGPESGFGYIECGEALAESQAHHVRRFVEKPARAQAEAFLAAGNFVWNSGMFCFTAGAILAAFDVCAPEILDGARRALAASEQSGGALRVDAAAFAALPSVSIDYAVMEKSKNVAVVPCDIGWSDVGNWTALAEVHPHKDEAGNAVIGDAVAINSQNVYVQADGRFIAAVGVRDLVVVDTPDALLVTHKDTSQDVKAVVDHLRRRKHAAALEHRTVHRPWGSFTVLTEGERFKVKRIVVKPGASLSLQMHQHRSEHWIVLTGTARVTRDVDLFDLHANQSTYIPVRARHRLHNPGAEDLVIIEVQVGAYVGEDDIVRYSDQYGRVPDQRADTALATAHAATGGT